MDYNVKGPALKKMQALHLKQPKDLFQPVDL